MFHLPVYHTMLPPPHLATQASHPVTLPRSAEGNDTATTQDLLEIHSRLYLCLQNTLTPTERLLPSPVVYQAGEPIYWVSQGA